MRNAEVRKNEDCTISAGAEQQYAALAALSTGVGKTNSHFTDPNGDLERFTQYRMSRFLFCPQC